MRLLVEVENMNASLNHSMETARVLEASLRDRISFLEAQLDGERESARSVTNSFSSYLSKFLNPVLALRIFKVSFPTSSRQPFIKTHPGRAH